MVNMNANQAHKPPQRSKSIVPDSHVSGQSNAILSGPAHTLSYEQLIEELTANSVDGLTTEEAQARFEKYGPNMFQDQRGVRPWKILMRQIANAMMLVLFLAMGVSFGIEAYIEGGVVGAVIVMNIVIGFTQEYTAEKTMSSLKSLSSPTANVVRDGVNQQIPSFEVVPGDMVELKDGDKVPADVRLVEALNFQTLEAELTGESLPVFKKADQEFPEDSGVGDRVNCAFSTTQVCKGRARGIVYATGMCTEIGGITAELAGKKGKRREVKTNSQGESMIYHYIQAWALTAYDTILHFLGVKGVGTPLQRVLSKLALILFAIAVVFALIVMGVNGFSNNKEVIIYAVATGLAMIPASLIVVLTITMARGTWQMKARKVIVRNMKALESLGSVTDVCSDKTGTLTQGKMVVARAWIPHVGTYMVETTDEPFNPTKGAMNFSKSTPSETKFSEEKFESMDPKTQSDVDSPIFEFLRVASLANLANIHAADDGHWIARGDPTEIAIQVFATRFDWNRSRWISGDKPAWKQVSEFPFDSDVKRMSAVYDDVENGKKVAFTKGAVERIVDRCSLIQKDESGTTAMTEDDKKNILKQMEALASLGLRTLALSSKEISSDVDLEAENARDEIETDLIFRGLVGIYDPPRTETAGSVKDCQDAGIVVHMLTGDHIETAKAIAREVGILPKDTRMLPQDVVEGMAMTGSEFDALSEKEIDDLPVLPLVIARCAPSTKQKMIHALHRRKRFVAMTGDGVNDAVALNEADVGIAMGDCGSDVAVDASDIVLTDDNFQSIVAAIEEGRRMFSNIQKFILHLLAQNVALALVLLLGLIFKDDSNFSVFPISPVEIMWIIMVTSSFPDMGLGFEAATPNIMKVPPNQLGWGVFTWEVIIDILMYGLLIAGLCLGAWVTVLFGWGNGMDSLGESCNELYSEGCDIVFRARATTFACMTWFSLFLAWELVDMRQSFFKLRRAGRPYFWQVLWSNKFLFFSIVFGFFTIFPVIYIPKVNQGGFRHTGITREWGVVFAATAIFWGGIEVWKWMKRAYIRRVANAAPEDRGKLFPRTPSKGSSNISNV